jgi:hypothetical protein
MARAQEVVQHYADNVKRTQLLVDAWGALRTRLKHHILEIEAEWKQSRLDLAAAYLLTLDAPSLAGVEQRTGYRGFSRRDPLKAMAHERAVLTKAIARIEADERWQRRTFLVGPSGEHTRELAEATSMLEPWATDCARFESLEGFLELVDVQYDTPHFIESWWQGSYWKHWAAGDRICTTLEMGDFGDDVLPAWRKVADPRDKWTAEVARIDGLIDAVHSLVNQRDTAEARIPRLPDLYLTSCHEQLSGFFAKADLGLLEEWLEQAGGDRGVQVLLRRVAGLQNKTAFLREMDAHGVAAQIEAFETREAKFRRKVTKYSRGKYHHMRLGQETMDLKFEQKFDKYAGAPGKLEKQMLRVVNFNDYDNFDLQNDPELWWLHMTRKRPSRYTPGLRSWYERHPDAAPQLEATDTIEAVSTAADAFDKTDRGYLS